MEAWIFNAPFDGSANIMLLGGHSLKEYPFAYGMDRH